MSYPARQGFHYPRPGWWDPFAEVDAMRRRLEQLFPGEPAQVGPAGWTGEVDVTETSDGWTVRAPLPGVPPEAVEVNLTDRELAIEGEAVSRAGQETHRFGYRMTLPGEVLADRVSATLEHGVLTVTLPRSPRAASRRIPVTTPGGTARTSADEQPTERLPRTRSSPAPGPDRPDDTDTSGVEPTTAPPYPAHPEPPYQEPPYGDAPRQEPPYGDAPHQEPPYQEPPRQEQAGPRPGAGYQQPDPHEHPEDSATARHPVPGQESPPAGYASLGQEGSRPGQHHPGRSPYLPWPNHWKTDQDHPT